jgi:hypothetical protein
MCHEATMQRLKTILQTGTIHPQKRQKKYYSPSWVWFCNAWDTKRVIEQVRPWLFTKAEEADIALEFLSLPLAPRGGWRGSRQVTPELEAKRCEFHKRLRDLKSRNKSGDKKANEIRVPKNKTKQSLSGTNRRVQSHH